ncbi:MAG: FG-GAP repeat protein [Gammaproteobacteria bacterium]
MPSALRPVFYQSLARDEDTAYRIDKDGCVKLPQQALQACFDRSGAHFSGRDTLAMRLVAYGHRGALAAVSPTQPGFEGNRVSYTHGGLAEWWRVLPVGFEQGFTLSKRPRGAGELVFALTANDKASRQDAGAPNGTLGWGELRYGKLVVTDANGKTVPATLRSKGDRILIAVNDTHAVYPLVVDPLVWMEQQKVTADDGGDLDHFGTSVAVVGDTALVGAPEATVGGNFGQGAAYVFTNSNGTWTQTAKLTANDGATYDYFSTSVALDGATALVGAQMGLEGPGAAYVFTESNGTWTQTAKLTASDGAFNDQFGTSVALDGTTAIVGAYCAPYDTGTLQCGPGAAYVFDESGGIWSQAQELTASDGNSGDQFGNSVALVGATALVGAPLANGLGNSRQGAAYVFDKSGGAWSQTQKLLANDGAPEDNFGFSVVLDGATALIGAPYATIGENPDQGAVYVFAESGGTWAQTAKLTASDGTANYVFGSSVALDGTEAVIGEPGATIGGNVDQGAAYVFDDAGGTWTQTAKLVASDGYEGDLAGTAVGLSGTTALMGAPEAFVGSNNQQGAAYFYTATCPQGYSEYGGTLNAGHIYGSPPYQAPTGIENGILGGPRGFQLYVRYSNGGSSHPYRISGNEIHRAGPAGTYRWGVKAGGSGGDYTLCVMHP